MDFQQTQDGEFIIVTGAGTGSWGFSTPGAVHSFIHAVNKDFNALGTQR